MRFRLSVFIGFYMTLIVLCPMTEALSDEEFKESVDKIVCPLIDSEWCVGIAIGFIHKDKTHIFTYGKDESSKPNANTVFEIASITKLFTALLMADSKERGEINFSDPVKNYLPSGTILPDKDGREINFVDLATHTSGLPDIMPDNINLLASGSQNPFDKNVGNELFVFLSKYKLPYKPGDGYKYSNIGMGLLAQILGKITGKSYEELVIERICRPLDMGNTWINITSEREKILATGHNADGDSLLPCWIFPGLEGCGAIRSNVNDMLKFIRAAIFPDKTKLGAAFLETQKTHYKMNENQQMGLGWIILPKLDFTVHAGTTPGFSSFIGISHKINAGVIVLSNTTGTPFSALHPASLVGYELLDILNGKNVPPLKLRKAVSISPDILKQYAGKYKITPVSFLTVTYHEGRLFIEQTDIPEKKFIFYPYSETEFFLKVADVQITFEKDKDGKVTNCIISHNGTKTCAEKVAD